MNTLVDDINAVDDYAAVQIVEFMYEELVNNYSENIETLIATVPDELNNVEGVSCKHLFFTNEDVALPQDYTHALSRRILLLGANEPAMAPLIEHALYHWPDDRQSVKKILSFGLVVAVLMFVASTSFTIKADWGEINKEAVSAEQILAIAKMIKELAEINKMGGS